jgi:hypothetical protein
MNDTDDMRDALQEEDLPQRPSPNHHSQEQKIPGPCRSCHMVRPRSLRGSRVIVQDKMR